VKTLSREEEQKNELKYSEVVARDAHVNSSVFSAKLAMISSLTDKVCKIQRLVAARVFNLHVFSNSHFV
jgi:hypothetical protein